MIAHRIFNKGFVAAFLAAAKLRVCAHGKS